MQNFFLSNYHHDFIHSLGFLERCIILGTTFAHNSLPLTFYLAISKVLKPDIPLTPTPVVTSFFRAHPNNVHIESGPGCEGESNFYTYM